MGYLPKIAYPSGAAPQTTLAFLYPPKKVASPRKGIRHDFLASSGVRQSVFERTDQLLDLDMPAAALGADLDGWTSFIENCGLQGLPFDYYPDATLTSYQTYVLESVDWALAYRAPGLYNFKLQFRLYVPGTAVVYGPAATTIPVALAPSAAGNFSVAHGLGRIPTGAYIQMTSGGAIWFQAALYDGTNLLLVASDAGVTGIAQVW